MWCVTRRTKEPKHPAEKIQTGMWNLKVQLSNVFVCMRMNVLRARLQANRKSENISVAIRLGSPRFWAMLTPTCVWCRAIIRKAHQLLSREYEVPSLISCNTPCVLWTGCLGNYRYTHAAWTLFKQNGGIARKETKWWHSNKGGFIHVLHWKFCNGSLASGEVTNHLRRSLAYPGFSLCKAYVKSHYWPYYTSITITCQNDMHSSIHFLRCLHKGTRQFTKCSILKGK